MARESSDIYSEGDGTVSWKIGTDCPGLPTTVFPDVTSVFFACVRTQRKQFAFSKHISAVPSNVTNIKTTHPQ